MKKMKNSLNQFIVIVSVITALFIQFDTKAQTFDFKWSESVDKYEFSKYIGTLNDEYIFSNRLYASNKCLVAKISVNDLKINNQFTVQEVNDSFKNYKNNFSIVSGNKILHGISKKKKKEKTELLRLVEWSETKNLLELVKDIFTFKYDKWSSIEYALSSDKSKLIVYKSIFSSKTFRNDYEYVVLDSAPVMLVSDTLHLVKNSDVVLYIVKSDFTEREMIDFAAGFKKENGIQNMTFVLNSVKPENTRYGKKYGYGYYSYTHDVEKKWWERFF